MAVAPKQKSAHVTIVTELVHELIRTSTSTGSGSGPDRICKCQLTCHRPTVAENFNVLNFQSLSGQLFPSTHFENDCGKKGFSNL